MRASSAPSKSISPMVSSVEGSSCQGWPASHRASSRPAVNIRLVLAALLGPVNSCSMLRNGPPLRSVPKPRTAGWLAPCSARYFLVRTNRVAQCTSPPGWNLTALTMPSPSNR